MKYLLAELVDVRQLQALTDELYAAADITSAIIAMDGEILTRSGWQRICTEFHRKHPQIERECVASDVAIRERLTAGDPFVTYTCPRGLTDASIPIIIEGQHLANAFVGQLFLTPPDAATEQRFRADARAFGLDEERYLAAFREIPIIPLPRFRVALRFLARLAEVIATVGLQRKQGLEALARLRESEARLRQAHRVAGLGSFVWHLQTGRLEGSDEVCQMFGRPRDGAAFPSLDAVIAAVHPDDRPTLERIRDELGSGAPGPYECRVVRPDGTSRTLAVEASETTRDRAGAPETLVGLVRDVTEQRRAEEERLQLQTRLLQSEKLEAIGTLAAGVAHDFNNLLGGMMGLTSLMRLKGGPSFVFREELRELERSMQSAAELIRQLLGLGRGGKYDLQCLDLNELLETSARMFLRTRKDLALECTYEPELWPVTADRSQLEQVVLNLCLNAGEAMRGGGRLGLATANVTLGTAEARAGGLAPGRYVRVAVSDTGAGMDAPTCSRVFEPFFTTKARGRGTGLGLASAHGIITHHGGHIEVASAERRGTTFTFWLPAREEPAAASRRPPETLRRGHETILLVDDEAFLVRTLTRVLELLGHEVLAASSGPEALEVFGQHRGRIALVLLDMIMPGMSGGAVFDALRALDPQVKVLLSSGYSIDGEAAAIMARGCNGFIQKPFNPETLSATLRALLNDAERG